MKNLLVIIVLLVSSNNCFSGSDASTEAEKRYLIMIAEQLSYIDELAMKARSNADPNSRIQLDYESLHNDLKDMQRALEQHVNIPARSPRTVPPLAFTK